MRMRSLIVGISVTLMASSTFAQHVESIDPRVYTKTRSGEPNAVRELSSKIDVAAAILSRGVGDDMHAPASAYPKGADIDALRRQEKRAALVGAIHAVATHEPADALALLSGEHALASRDALVRAEAAAQIGALGDASLAALARAAEDHDAAVREAAMVGIGRVRTMRALDVLTPFLVNGDDARTQSAAIKAAGAMTSTWAWQARGDKQGKGHAAMRAAVIDVLVTVERTDKNSAALDHVRNVWLK